MCISKMEFNTLREFINGNSERVFIRISNPYDKTVVREAFKVEKDYSDGIVLSTFKGYDIYPIGATYKTKLEALMDSLKDARRTVEELEEEIKKEQEVQSE